MFMQGRPVTAIAILALLLEVPAANAADSVVYGEGVVGPQKHATSVQALGPDLFGEAISTYTGGLSFAQTDLSIPGIGNLSVDVTRRLILDGNKSPSWASDANLWRGYAFGEWELDLPYMNGMYSASVGWVVNTTNQNARCSSPTTYAQFRPKDVSVGEVYFSSYNFWNGINLHTAGGGDQQLLYRPAGGSLPMPAGTWTALTTKDQWHFSCLSTLKSGQAGEGFLALAPDGTRYWFDWMVSYPDRPLHGQAIIEQGLRPYRVQADLPRNEFRLYPTRIEDRFGNYVTYAWSGSSLNTITANDGRSITLAYSGGRIVSATSGATSVQYSYADGLLSSVTMPDGGIWSFSTSAVVNLPRFVALGSSDPFDFPMTCQLMRRLTGTEADLSMTHPSGASGVFRLGYNRLYRTGLTDPGAAMCSETSAPDGTIITWRDHQPYVPVRHDVLALKRKTLSGPGISSLVWQFQHQDNYQWNGSPDQYPMAGTRAVTTTEPDNSTVVEVFGTEARTNEGQLLSREVREGGNALSRLDNIYVQSSEMTSMPFPDWMGEPLAYEFIRGRGDYNRPLKSSVLKQQGVSFSNTVNQFDVLARPVRVTKSSAPTP